MRPAVWKKASAYLEDPRVLLGVYLLVALAVALQKTAVGSTAAGGRLYPPYQNYVIFRNAFSHLLAGRDLYAAFPLEQADLFKYTPTFALAMAPIAALPYTAGAVAWNAVNAAALFLAVWRLPPLDRRRQAWALWFVFLSLLSSMQTAQSNGLMAGLMLGAFAAREQGRPALSALLVAAAASVKPFGLVALIACLTQPGRRGFLAWVMLWITALFALPLVVVAPAHLGALYRSWARLLASDHAAKTGLSVMAWLESWFGLTPPRTLVAAAGGLALVAPMFCRGRFDDAGWRVAMASSVLVYVVIFNHMAESPTYVIAVAGVATWYFSRPASAVDTALVIGTFVLTCLAATDLLPRSVRMRAVAPYALKAVPCIAVWVKLQYDLLAGGAGGEGTGDGTGDEARRRGEPRTAAPPGL